MLYVTEFLRALSSITQLAFEEKLKRYIHTHFINLHFRVNNIFAINLHEMLERIYNTGRTHVMAALC